MGRVNGSTVGTGGWVGGLGRSDRLYGTGSTVGPGGQVNVIQSGRGHQDDEAKNGSPKFQRFGHKIGPKAFPDVILVPIDR